VGLVSAVKRLFKVEVEVEFEPATDTVYVWAEDEDEAERIAEEDVDDLGTEPPGIEKVSIEGCDEASVQEFEHELRYHGARWLPGAAAGETLKTMEATIRESLAEEERALAAWAAQRVLPGMPPPPLPERCVECGARPPLSAHKESCPNVTSPDRGGCDDVSEGGSHP
jgi:hypothetical protein